MAIQFNRYYNVKAAGPEAIRLTTNLLQSYPTTRACLGILGNKLLERVEFGFFKEDQPFITQGEQGKDLFLLCDESVDVFVDGKKVVQMEAPALLGDKGIVDPESRRAATISAAPEKTCFLLKIPMGLFIRNFDDMSIEDASFTQEIGIFYNMFKGIQSRLFEFSFIQKNIWEEAVTTQTLAKTQRLIKILDNRIDEGWDEGIWETVRVHLLDSLGFQWPDGVPLDISTFRNLLRQYLDEKFPRDAFKGKDADYIKKKHQIWRKWLTATAAIILKGLPLENNEIDGSMIQLFNPRNYQIRIQGLIRAIEKRFLTTKTREVSNNGKKMPQKTGTGSIKSFFGRTEQDNTFDLKSYLSSFERTFQLKFPKRMQTQIAQRTALVAAKCENEFNESVAAMKTLLEKSQSQLSGSYKIQPQDINDSSEKELLSLNQAVVRYYQHLDEPFLGKKGKVTYKHQSTPSIDKLLKSMGVKHAAAEIARAIQGQIKKLNISARLLTFDFIKSSFHLCEAAAGSEIHSHDLERHYWMPLSPGVRLFSSDHEFVEISPGSLIGGKGWVQDASDESGQSMGSWKLKMPEQSEGEGDIHQKYLILVLPSQMFPWEVNPNPNARIFKAAHLPLMQWLINKQIGHIALHLPARDQAFENLQKTKQVLRLEKKVKAFENSSVKISADLYFKISNFLKNTLGVILPDKPFPSNVLAKKIYNFILKQMTIDYQRHEPEKVGNRTYTKWRLILSEIVQITEQSELEKSILTSTPFFEIIENELGSILDSFLLTEAKKYIRLTGQTPYIQLPQILNELENPGQDRHLLFELILSTLETYLRLSIEETRFYRHKNEAANKNRSQTDVQALQTDTILESSGRLRDIIMQKQQGAVQPISKSA